ncbi:MAG: rRNA maturation RNase YbeY [Bacteroidales bacterium]|nr:rRNA maturation RNase YbeY [Bacteroidales bacterium]
MIRYFTEDIVFSLNGKALTKQWLKEVAAREDRLIGNINIIFCSDSYLLEINRKFLSHDYYTDIITFDDCEGTTLNGDLFISIDSVRANAEEYAEGRLNEELDRVMVHGILHLIGYDDHTGKEQQLMRSKENEYLSLRKKFEK